MKLFWGVCLLLAVGCSSRTAIRVDSPKGDAGPAYVTLEGCNVRDFPSATDLPQGSKNLGWVTVEQQEDDDETFLLLRRRICERGGDALSQAAWVKAPSEEVVTLRANAWSLP